MRDEASPYRIRQTRVVPKFGKNPFMAPPKTDAPAAQPVPAQDAPAAQPVAKPAVAVAPAKLVTDSLFDPRPVPAPAAAPVKVVAAVSAAVQPKLETIPVPSEPAKMEAPAIKVQAQPTIVSKAGTPRQPELAPAQPAGAAKKRGIRFWGWLGKLNPVWLLFGGRPGRPAKARGGMQPELSLEQVRVARNDLRDSDLEVVALRRPKPAREPAPAAPPAQANTADPVNLDEPTAWGRLTSRLFGEGHTAVK
jgi:hypothetical protein